MTNGPGAPVLAVTGLAREARLASGDGVDAVGAGGNAARLRALLEARDPAGCRAVISFGIAGGLAPDLVAGDVVVATRVVASDESEGARAWEVDAHLRRGLAESLGAGRPRLVEGALVGSDVAVMTAAAKAALHRRTGAMAVDMESHVAAAFAARHGLPFCALRVVCDPAERALPAFVAHALKPNGEPDVLATLSALVRGGVTPAALWRLARDSGEAFRSLGRCRAALGLGLGFGLGLSDL